MKKTLLILVSLLSFTMLFAASAKYESENYNLNLNYNDVITPGDGRTKR